MSVEYRIKGQDAMTEIYTAHGAFGVEVADMMEFGDVARRQLSMQAQYASRYIHGRLPGYPRLSDGLRVYNREWADYHGWKIHPDDVAEFVRRVQAHKAQ